MTPPYPILLGGLLLLAACPAPAPGPDDDDATGDDDDATGDDDDATGDDDDATGDDDDSAGDDDDSAGDDDDDATDDASDADGDGWSSELGDCNDDDPSIYPGAPGPADGIDVDCDGRVEYQLELWLAVDDAYTLCLDGEVLGSGGGHTATEYWTATVDAGLDHVLGVHGEDTSGVSAALGLRATVAGLEFASHGLTEAEADTTAWRYFPEKDDDPQATWCDVDFDDSAWGPALLNDEVGDGAWLANPPGLQLNDVEWIWDGRPTSLADAWFRRRFSFEATASDGSDATSCSLITPPQRVSEEGRRLHAGVGLAWTGAAWWGAWDLWFSPWREGVDELFLQELGADGLPLGAPEMINETGSNSWWNTNFSMAWTGSHFGFVWEDGRDNRQHDRIYFGRATEEGVRAEGADVQLTSHGSDARYPSLAWHPTLERYGVAWQDGREDFFRVRFRQLNEDGTPMGTETVIGLGAGPSRRPSLVQTATGWAVAWSDLSNGTREIWFQRLEADGTLIGTPTVVSPGSTEAGAPVLRWTGEGFGLAWQAEDSGSRQIHFASLDAEGTLLSSGAVTSSSRRAADPSLAWTGAGWGLAWRDSRDGNDEIYMQELSGDGTPLDGPLRVSEGELVSWRPVLVWAEEAGEFGLIWHEADDPDFPFRLRAYFSRILCP